MAAQSRGLSQYSVNFASRESGLWYNAREMGSAGKVRVMIELTEQQLQELAKPGATPPRVVNPQTKETFVLLPVEAYQRLTGEEYDDSPWTREELEALAWSATGADEEDDEAEKP
jgi:hypothetical protein